jgi:hypothetical protein
VAGNPTKIVSLRRKSNMGIHVAAKSPHKTISDLENKKMQSQD